MSDEQKGPYTPRDQPLAFDPRGPRDARPMPMTLIASGLVLLLLVGGVIVAYAGGFHRKDDPSKPVGDHVLVMKTAPPPGQAGAVDPASRMAVYSNHTDAADPQFAAGPEAPAERPKPQLQVREQTLPPVRIASSDALAPAVAANPVVPTSTLLPAAKATKPAPEPVAAAPQKAAADKPAVAGGAGVQIGAFSSRDLADKGYADVGKLVPTGGHGKRIEAVERGGSTLYRTTVTGFSDRAAAKSFCESLTAKGHACIVKG